jgi:hypothetical protein
VNKHVERTNNHDDETSLIRFIPAFETRRKDVQSSCVCSRQQYVQCEVRFSQCCRWSVKSSGMLSHFEWQTGTDVRKTIRSSETSPIYQSTQCNIPESLSLHIHFIFLVPTSWIALKPTRSTEHLHSLPTPYTSQQWEITQSRSLHLKYIYTQKKLHWWKNLKFQHR